MKKAFFISDTHFGDKNIIKFEDRPFNSVDEMDDKMIENWNSVVSDEDVVYVVGDFISNIDKFDILNNLNGTIKLIIGNHDKKFISKYEEYKNVEIINYSIILDEFWIVSHKPIYMNTHMPYVNIFGHVHTNPIYNSITSNSFCVCVERNNYTPVDFRFIKKSISEKAKE